ncbi:MAG: hypothetical protein HPM95_05470 [Alphaproteobacteria bacterium]|nr:hypothetical protein [Alphaproteobacteria bacterium]
MADPACQRVDPRAAGSDHERLRSAGPDRTGRRAPGHRRRLNVFLETSNVNELEKLVREGEYRIGTIVLVLLAEGRTRTPSSCSPARPGIR